MTKIIFPFDIDAFFEKHSKHSTFPSNDFEKQAILLKLLDEFKDEKIYLEDEVNEKIKKHFKDFALLRRELINFNYMKRNNVTGEYWVVKRNLTQDDVRNNTFLRRDIKKFKILDEDKN